MSVAAPGDRRSPWIYLIAFAAVAVAATALVLARTPHRAPSATSSSAASDPVAPTATHESWTVDAYPTGAVAKVSPAQRARVKAQVPRLDRLVRSVYGAVFLTPSRLERALAVNFSPTAAKAFRRTKVGLPRGTKELEKLRVAAKVGIQAQGATRAAALVRVVVAGEAHDKDFTLVHRGSLWLERRNHAWKVVGFDFEQSPYRAPQHKKSAGKKSGHHKKGNK